MTVVAPVFWWEDQLTKHFLRADGPNGSSPISFIDTSPEELARATGRPRIEGEAALRDLLSIFSRRRLVDVLTHGEAPRQARSLEGPGWFHVLVLTCVVGSVSPEISAAGHFRDRFKDLLGLGSPIQDFSALPKLWSRLNSWLDDRREQGLPYRRIVLPELGNMRQIGYSVRIAFPSRHDLDRMRRLYAALAEKPVDLDGVIRTVRPDLGRHSWSSGFKACFQDFERRRHNRERLLGDHPFLKAIASLVEPERLAATTDVFCTTDIDGIDAVEILTDNIALRTQLGLPGANEGGVEVDIPSLVRILTGVARFGVDTNLPWLGRCVQEGIVPFADDGWGRWRACRVPETPEVRLLVAPAIGRKHLGLGHDGWSLTDPLRLGRAVDVLDAVRGLVRRIVTVGTCRLNDAIRVGSMILGRPSLMPVLEVGADCDIRLERIREERGDIALDTTRSQLFGLKAKAPVAGTWRASIKEKGSSATTEILLEFVDRALEHTFLESTDIRATWQVQADVEPLEPRPVDIPGHLDASGSPAPAMLDLLEAVYAKGGGVGIADGVMFEYVSRAFGLNGSVAWDIVRLLEEAGWIQPRLSATWKARRWFVRSPRLQVSACGDVAMLDGAVSEVVRDRVELVCKRLGGRLLTRAPAKGLGVPTHIVDGVLPASVALAADLRLQAAEVPLGLARDRLRFASSTHSAERRGVGSTWDWRTGRFRRWGAASDEVKLERLVKSGDTARALYGIRLGDRLVQVSECRSTAILQAYAMAGRPMFKPDASGDRIRRLPSEGHLPLEVARYLRLSSGSGAVVVPIDDWSAEYLYPIPPSALDQLSAWLGPAVEAPTAPDVKTSGGDPLRTLVMCRRRGRHAAAANLWI